MTDKELADAALANLLKPKVVEVDGQRVENQSAADMLKIAKLMASKEAVGRRAFPVRITRMKAGGGAV